jgi:hypothetical protein
MPALTILRAEAIAPGIAKQSPASLAQVIMALEVDPGRSEPSQTAEQCGDVPLSAA